VTTWRKPLPESVTTVVATALGREHRDDPVSGATGGPAGNARLTAWLGLLLLVAFVVECATLIQLGGLIQLHIIVGVLLVGLVLAKTATTGWRILRYYRGDPLYRRAGPPPMILRVLGPLVVIGGLAVLGTGLALVALGRATHAVLLTVGPLRIDAVTLHQVAFVVWLAVTVPHTVTRLVPAMQLVLGRGRRVLPRSGAVLRVIAVVAVLALGAVAAGFVVDDDSGGWIGRHHRDGDDGLSRGTVIVAPVQAADRRR
jgi:hypothetical protein